MCKLRIYKTVYKESKCILFFWGFKTYPYYDLLLLTIVTNLIKFATTAVNKILKQINFKIINLLNVSKMLLLLLCKTMAFYNVNVHYYSPKT